MFQNQGGGAGIFRADRISKKKQIYCILFALVLIGTLCFFLLSGVTKNPYDSLPLWRYSKAHHTGPYLSYSTLAQIEADADLIVETVVSEVTGPAEAKYYSAEIYNTMPIGHTEKEVILKKVYQGDAEKGNRITIAEPYYIWTEADGTRVLVSDSYVKPLEEGERYLLFLKYREEEKLYRPVADYMSIYETSSKKQISKALEGTLQQEDLSYLYQDWDAINWYPVYLEVMEKYFIGED